MEPEDFRTKLNELLQTEQPEEQLARIQGMMGALRTPPIALLIQHDPMSRQTHIGTAGRPLTTDEVHQILSLAMRELARREAQAALEATTQSDQNTGGNHDA